MQKSILKPVLTIVVIFIIVGVFVFLTKTNVSENKEMGNVTEHGISFEDIDAIGLYPEFKWNFQDDFTYDVFGLAGYIVESYPVEENITEAKSSFRKYFEDMLLPLGYKEALEVSADGVASSVWGYKRDKYYVVLSYEGQPLVPKEGAFDCPCSWTFKVFTGKKVNP